MNLSMNTSAPSAWSLSATLPRRTRVLVSDSTYIGTTEGWPCLAVVMDLCSRRIVCLSMSERLSTNLVLWAFWMKVLTRRPPKGLVFHSDRGSQYTSHEFRGALKHSGMIQA